MSRAETPSDKLERLRTELRQEYASEYRDSSVIYDLQIQIEQAELDVKLSAIDAELEDNDG